MVEIERCRRCAMCCYKCIFLEYDEDTELFSCLIYLNKGRYPFQSDSWYIQRDEDIQDFIKRFFWAIEEIIHKNEFNMIGVCDTYICFYLKNKNMLENEQIILTNEQNEDVLKRRMQDRLNEVREARKLIPDFNTLVEILNEPC